MKGTWSMVFHGKVSDLAGLLEGVKELEEPRWETFRKPLLKAAKNLRGLPGNGTAELRADGVWKNALIGLTGAVEAFHRFAPNTEAACRTMLDEYCYIDYLAPGTEKAAFTELKFAGAEEYEGESDGLEYAEAELPSGKGGKRAWKVEKRFRFIVDVWDLW